MNPFIIWPKSITSVDGAKSALKFFQPEISVYKTASNGIEDNLSATLEVLIASHPELESDFRLIAHFAKSAGDAQRHVQDLIGIQDEFRRALPFAIRTALEAEGK